MNATGACLLLVSLVLPASGQVPKRTALEELLRVKSDQLEKAFPAGAPLEVMLASMSVSEKEARLFAEESSRKANSAVVEEALASLRAGLRLALETYEGRLKPGSAGAPAEGVPSRAAADAGLVSSSVSAPPLAWSSLAVADAVASKLTGEMSKGIPDPSKLLLSSATATIGKDIAQRAFVVMTDRNKAHLLRTLESARLVSDVKGNVTAESAVEFLNSLKGVLNDAFSRQLAAVSKTSPVEAAKLLLTAAEWASEHPGQDIGSLAGQDAGLGRILSAKRSQLAEVEQRVANQRVSFETLGKNQARIESDLAELERKSNAELERVQSSVRRMADLQVLTENGQSLPANADKFRQQFHKELEVNLARGFAVKREIDLAISEVVHLPSQVIPKLDDLKAEAAKGLLSSAGLPLGGEDLKRFGDVLGGRTNLTQIANQLFAQGQKDLLEAFGSELKPLKAQLGSVSKLLSGNLSESLGSLLGASNPMTMMVAQSVLQGFLGGGQSALINGKLDEVIRQQREILARLDRIESKLDAFQKETRENFEKVFRELRDIKDETVFVKRLLVEIQTDQELAILASIPDFAQLADNEAKTMAVIQAAHPKYLDESWQALWDAGGLKDGLIRARLSLRADLGGQTNATIDSFEDIAKLLNVHYANDKEGLESLLVRSAFPRRYSTELATGDSARAPDVVLPTSVGFRPAVALNKENLVSPAKLQLFATALIKQSPYYFHLDQTWGKKEVNAEIRKEKVIFLRERLTQYVQLTNIAIAQWSLLSGDSVLPLYRQQWATALKRLPQALERNSVLARNLMQSILRGRINETQFRLLMKGPSGQPDVAALNHALAVAAQPGRIEVSPVKRFNAELQEETGFQMCLIHPDREQREAAAKKEKSIDICAPLPTADEMASGTLYWQPGLSHLISLRDKLLQTMAELDAPGQLSEEDRRSYYAAVALVGLGKKSAVSSAKR